MRNRCWLALASFSLAWMALTGCQHSRLGGRGSTNDRQPAYVPPPTPAPNNASQPTAPPTGWNTPPRMNNPAPAGSAQDMTGRSNPSPAIPAAPQPAGISNYANQPAGGVAPFTNPTSGANISPIISTPTNVPPSSFGERSTSTLVPAGARSTSDAGGTSNISPPSAPVATMPTQPLFGQ